MSRPWILLAALLAAVPTLASPVRVATLGGESRLLLDSSNLLLYPALATDLAQFDVELFDDWALATAPVGRHALGLTLNRRDVGTERLADYVAGTGSGRFQALDPRPWLDVFYGLRASAAVALAAGARYAYDVRDDGADEASASRLETRLGAAIGSGDRRLDAVVSIERVALRDLTAGVRSEETDGTGVGVDLRGRWRLGRDSVLLPSFTWSRSAYGLSPQEGRWSSAQAAIGVNVRPTPTVLGVAGVIVASREQRLQVPGDGIGARETTALLLPAVVAGGEVQVGSVLCRLGLRHESVLRTQDTRTGREKTFDSALQTDVGLGFEFGAVVVDGVLEKDFLRDGPHFIGGSARGGGLLSTVSLVYRLYR